MYSNLKYTLYFRYSPAVLYVGFNLKPQERHTPHPQPQQVKKAQKYSVCRRPDPSQLLMTDTPPLIKLSCPPPSPVNFQLWGFHILSPVSSVCSVESASHRRSPVRPERKCVFSGSAAAGLMSEPVTAVVDPCSAPRAFSALLLVRVRAISLPLLLSYLYCPVMPDRLHLGNYQRTQSC